MPDFFFPTWIAKFIWIFVLFFFPSSDGVMWSFFVPVVVVTCLFVTESKNVLCFVFFWIRTLSLS